MLGRLARVLRRVGSGADDDRAHRSASAHLRQRAQQHVDALEVPQLADEQEVGRARSGLGLRELLGCQAVRDDARCAGRRADLGRIARGCIAALEHDRIGVARELPLEAHVDASRRGRGVIVQAAAVRRVAAHDRLAGALHGAGNEARVGAALGAVAVDDVEVELERPLRDGAQGGDVAQAELAAHGHPQKTKSQVRRQPFEAILGESVGGGRIAHDADPVAAPGLLQAQVADMAEEPAHRRAQAMQDAKPLPRRSLGDGTLRASARRRRACRRAGQRSPVEHPSSR